MYRRAVPIAVGTKMKNLRLFLSLFSIFCIQGSFAQSYFQQRVNYTINVKLNDEKHLLSGFETVEYNNHSDDTLTFIYFHIWPNAYKNNSTALAKQFLQQGKRDFYFAPESDKGYIDSLDFKIEGLALKTEIDKENPDICKVYLSKPLYPADKIFITTPFRVKIPSCRFSRLGHDKQAYYISQWYPKPAVYDENGWNQMPYLDQGEFYSEFGKYDVSITLPKNYVLSATGERYGAQEEEDFLNKKITETENIIKSLATTIYRKNLSFPPSDKEYKTVRFKQDNVHDFAWFADKRFHVMRGDLVLPHTKKNVYTWAFFTDDKIELWKDAVSYISDATFYYSLWNGDYVYNHVSAVDGVISAGGGMEYPMVTIIGEADTPFDLDVVITHEVGHNWFYGMLGSNERKHAWMDEGINSFNEMRYIKTKYPGATVAEVLGRDSTNNTLGLNKIKQAQSYYLLYVLQAKKNEDQPCELPSVEYSELNYAAIVYSKTAVLFNYLMNYMGEADFDIAMQFYFEQIKLKHPNPGDLKKVLEYFSEKKLDWFFDDLIGTTKKLDYKIVRSFKEEIDGTYSVEVKNNGDIKGPVALCATKNGKVVGMVWYDGFEGSKVLEFPFAEIDAFKIDYFGFMPEVNRKNNILRTRGIFKKVEPLKLHFIASMDNPDKTQLFVAPVASFNMYNGFMLGGAYYNHTIFDKRFETEIVPMYAFKNNDITGLANFHLNFHPDKVFSNIIFYLKTARFAFEEDLISHSYNKIAPGVSFEIKKKRVNSTYTHRFGYRYVQIQKEYTNFYFRASDTTYYSFRDDFTYGVHDVLYQLNNNDALFPFTLKLNFLSGNDVQKISLSYNQKMYVNSSKYFELRAFVGKMLYMNTSSTHPLVDYRFRTSGWAGSNDYLYDYSYAGRAEPYGLAANQFTEVDGAFKIYTPLGQSADWIAALNIKSPKVFKLPLKFYADIGTCANDGLVVSSDNLLYNAGLEIIIVKDICEVFVPLLVSKNIQDANATAFYQYGGLDFWHQIRFTLNLNRANPFALLKQEVEF